ncbi:MAG: DNA polymerase III subunit [Ruminococcaceae bacterium]|nr:DNA polymerase III subunit [Oscillospiraceae bacterium]
MDDKGLIYGNDALLSQIKREAESGKISHAYILYGRPGIGKKTFAQYMARAFVCKGEKKPCGSCSACVKSVNGNHPDIITVRPEDGAKTVTIAQIRSMTGDMSVMPNEADKKIYIVEQADTMQGPAQNALLKCFEEPPAYGVMILCCDNINALLPTILSRGRKLQLSSVSDGQMLRYLKQKFPEKSADEIEKAAVMARGTVGQAVQMLEKGMPDDELYERFCSALAARREYDLIKLGSDFLKNGKDGFEAAADGLIVYLRDIISKKTVKNGYSYYSDKNNQAADALPISALLGITAVIDNAKQKMIRNGNPNIVVNDMLVSCWEQL